MILYSVRPDLLIEYAAQIEIDAAQSLKAWIILGQSARYGDALSAARALRQAAAERSVSMRRETLRSAGFIVKTPKDARSPKPV